MRADSSWFLVCGNRTLAPAKVRFPQTKNHDESARVNKAKFADLPVPGAKNVGFRLVYASGFIMVFGLWESYPGGYDSNIGISTMRLTTGELGRRISPLLHASRLEAISLEYRDFYCGPCS